jgi:hypothetical protein
MMEFITRDYNSITLNKDRGTITKISSEKRLGDEAFYYLQIPSKVAHYFPRAISSAQKGQIGWESDNYLLELEYLPFENLGNLWLSSKLDDTLWINICKYLREAISTFSTIPYEAPSPSTLRKKMFIDKTEREYNSLITNFAPFSRISSFDSIHINSKLYQNFDPLWNEFLREYVSNNYCGDEPLTFMHGDLCFSNILCGYDKEKNVVLKFIDPRGSFGKVGCAGDLYYDLAKLMHSIDGKYECFIYDKFELLTHRSDSYSLSFSEDLQHLSPVFSDHLFPNYDEVKIKVLQGLIYIGMCARHYDSSERQLAMYLTGLRILNECKEQLDA